MEEEGDNPCTSRSFLRSSTPVGVQDVSTVSFITEYLGATVALLPAASGQDGLDQRSVGGYIEMLIRHRRRFAKLYKRCLCRCAVSVCLVSVTFVYCVEASERILKLFHHLMVDTPFIFHTVPNVMAIFQKNP